MRDGRAQSTGARRARRGAREHIRHARGEGRRMARISRRQLEELRRIVGAPEACQDCKGMFYIGMPGLFVYLEIPKSAGDPPGAGTHREGTPEEFERYFDGCPTCGQAVKTKPIIMSGLV